MIGSGFKKLAAQYQLHVGNGIAYGSLMGYTTTLSEGAGFKRIQISTTFPQLNQKEAFYSAVNSVDCKNSFRVNNLDIHSHSINVVFADSIGTMDKIHAFIRWFYPLLGQYGATNSSVCIHCGSQTMEGNLYLIGDIVHYMHDSCANHVIASVDANDAHRRQEDSGSCFTGFLGALGGALLGAVAWALMYMAGYVASIIGLLMGWLAEKGYDLLHGKRNKTKIVILIICVIIGVLVGNYAGFIMKANQEYGDYMSMEEIVETTNDLLANDSEFQGDFFTDIALGLVFAGLGVYYFFKKATQEVSNTRVIKLS